MLPWKDGETEDVTVDFCEYSSDAPLVISSGFRPSRVAALTLPGNAITLTMVTEHRW